jgi:hypothetical protein
LEERLFNVLASDVIKNWLIPVQQVGNLDESDSCSGAVFRIRGPRNFPLFPNH